MPEKILGKPESHSDVLNKHPRTLLIGYGWVGQFVHKYFTEADYYTPNLGHCKANGEKQTEDTQYEIGFVGVPSPIQPDGSCDTSYLDSAVKQWHERVKTFIVRSTVTPGTVDRLSEEYPDNHFVMQPEYVGETLGHPLTEPTRDTFVILGGTPEATAIAAEAWQRVLHPNSYIYQVTGKTAELCKYMENSFLATKVIFVNDFRRLAEAMGVNFQQLREVWLADPRINRSHTFAYPENPGFSGKCLPKDLNSIVHYARYVIKRPLELIESLLRINYKMRDDEAIHTTEKLAPEASEYRKALGIPTKPEEAEDWDAQ